MLRKILTFNLLIALALLPVAQAVSPAGAPAETAHELMLMDCGEVDPNHCIDFTSCVAGSHASCDPKTKSTQLPLQPADMPRGRVYTTHPPERYLSYCSELLLRPPRIA